MTIITDRGGMLNRIPEVRALLRGTHLTMDGVVLLTILLTARTRSQIHHTILVEVSQWVAEERGAVLRQVQDRMVGPEVGIRGVGIN